MASSGYSHIDKNKQDGSQNSDPRNTPVDLQGKYWIYSVVYFKILIGLCKLMNSYQSMKCEIAETSYPN